MPKRKVVKIERTPTKQLELVSYGRKSSSNQSKLSVGQIEQIMRTVRKTPEVMVKVSGGAKDVGGAKAHFSYIDRHGKLEIHTDEGLELLGKDAAEEMIKEWNLDLSKGQYKTKKTDQEKDNRPKVVHNIVLSMPDSTPPEKVLEAAKVFARENFSLQHRYAMTLHTDQEHPHVHLVVKAEHEYEAGKRLYVRKATLQKWRDEFAEILRELNVPANATPRQLRGISLKPKKDAIHHRLKDISDKKGNKHQHKESTFMKDKVTKIAKEVQSGKLKAEPGKKKLIATREQVIKDWSETANKLRNQGEESLAKEVENFIESLPKIRTEKEQIAAEIIHNINYQRTQDINKLDGNLWHKTRGD